MLEIACFTARSALAAAHTGAPRLELCASYAAGGLTPTLSTLHDILADLPQPAPRMHIMIRPRGGGFVYSAAELGAMKRSIAAFRAAGKVDGFVFGVLTEAGTVDEAGNRELLAAAGDVPCTFHRAVDEVADVDAAVEVIVGLGFRSVLTSGGRGSAREGAECVARLQERYGGRISVILGGGIRSSNVVGLKAKTGVEWVHSAAITEAGEEVDEEEVKRMLLLLRISEE